MKKLILALILAIAVSGIVWAADTGEIVVKMTGFRSGQGRVSVVLYNDSGPFPKEADKAVKIVRTQIKGDSSTAVFKDIPYGEYAFVILHDENLNGAMDYDSIGRPKEGYAFSNNATGMVGAPSYSNASFKLDKPKVTQTIEMIY
jgi:uncharacterized protein (DUF2141 family)